jgi:hypothetical protein
MTDTLQKELRYTITNKLTLEKSYMATLPGKQSKFRKSDFIIFDNLLHKKVVAK